MRAASYLLVSALLVGGFSTIDPTAAHARSKPVAGTLKVKFSTRKQRLLLRWEGRILHPMARQFVVALDRWLPRARNGVIVELNSGGGKLREMARVIRILKFVRETHRLDTVVRNGRRCGSSCVPIFLQGQHRRAGYASAWLFHEITTRRQGVDGRPVKIARPARTDTFYRNYFLDAGVSPEWVERTRFKIEGADYWLTGADLFRSRSGIATELMSNHTRRRLGHSRFSRSRY